MNPHASFHLNHSHSHLTDWVIVISAHNEVLRSISIESTAHTVSSALIETSVTARVCVSVSASANLLMCLTASYIRSSSISCSSVLRSPYKCKQPCIDFTGIFMHFTSAS